MTGTYLDNLILAIPVLKYVLLFLLVMIEGPLVTMAAGFLASQGEMDFFIAYPVILAGEIASDSVYYAVGYLGRRRLAGKLTSYIKVTAGRLEKIEKVLHRHLRKSVVIAKLTHFAGVPFLLSAGMARVKFYIFLIYDFLATLPKSLIFLLLGYFFGKAFITINRYLEYGSLIVSGIIILAFIVYLFIGKYFAEKYLKEEN